MICTITGAFDPRAWPAACDALDRLLPTWLGASSPADPPEGIEAIVEAVAGRICTSAGFPPSPVERRRPMPAETLAGLSEGFAPLTRAALRLAVELLDAVQRDGVEAWLPEARKRVQLMREGGDNHLPTSRRRFARAADARGIPWRAITGVPHHLLIGEGRYGRRLDGTTTWRTSEIAVQIAANKRLCNLTLSRAGVPVARQRQIATLDDARGALAELGLPMVIKPEGGRRQGGASFIFRPEQIERAFAHSSVASRELVAESWLPGPEYRVLVADREIISAVSNRTPAVTGDGRSTIRQLIECANRDPRRGARTDGFRIGRIPVDQLTLDFLEHQQLTLDDIPAPGAVTTTYPLASLRFGSPLKREVADLIHPDTRDMLVRTVSVLGLDIGGIDYRTSDITRSWRQVDAGICEVNPQPGINAHYEVEDGNARDVAGIMLDRVYPEADRGRMIHVAILSDANRSALGRRLADALADAEGWRVALVEATSVDLAGYRAAGPIQWWQHAQAAAIEDPTLDAAVHLMRPQTVVATGLGLVRADVALIDASAGTPDEELRLAARSAQAAGAQVVRLPPSTDDAIRGVLSVLARRRTG